MKIWFQSASPLGEDPKYRDYSLLLEKHVREIVRPGTEVKLAGVDIMSPDLTNSSYISYIHSQKIVANAFRAEKEGYDAYAVGCMNDPGYYEIKEVLGIPAAFMTESAMLLACMLGSKFSFVSYSERSLWMKSLLIQRYGLSERAAPMGHFRISLEQVSAALTDPAPALEACIKAAEQVIDQGAEVIIPGCGILNILLAQNGIRNIKGAVVLDITASLLKAAETLADLHRVRGLTVSKRLSFASVDKERMALAKKLYGVD